MADLVERPAKRSKQEIINVDKEGNHNVFAQAMETNSDLLREANEALQQSNRIHLHPIIDETKLGIELFVGDRKNQFHGIIKTRYTDFIVHEIDLEGNIAYLTNLDPLEDQEPAQTTKLEDLVDAKALECITEVNNGYLNQYKIDVTYLDKDARTSLHRAIRASFDRLESSTISEHESQMNLEDTVNIGLTINNNDCPDIKKDDSQDKPDSTQQVAGDNSNTDNNSVKPESKTESSEAKKSETELKFIVIKKRGKASRPKNIWPRDRPDYTHFILYKENKDTLDAIYNLAPSVNIRPANFHSAGIKDRRAITSQWMSCWRLEPKRLIAATRRFSRRPFIKVGNFCFKKEPLRLGQLKGNKFDIVVRHLIHNPAGAAVINQAVNDIKQNGFINYFGLQRFGTRSIQTHEIGLAVLQVEWEKAVDLILSYRFDDNMHPPPPKMEAPKIQDDSPEDDSKQQSPLPTTTDNYYRVKQDPSHKRFSNDASQHNAFIDLWKSKLDAEIVFKKFPQFRFSNEGQLMKYLSKSEEFSRDYLNAMLALPRSTRSMYVHSYQSLIWNKTVTYRLKKHGFKVIPGDLILPDVSDDSLEVLLTTDDVNSTCDGKIGGDTSSDTKQDSLPEKRKAPIELIESKIIIATEENLANYSVFDVILPIVGSRTRFPENDVKEVIERYLKEDGIDIESFKRSEKQYISYGSYRKVMVKPGNVNWKIEQYSDPNQTLVETDIDRLIKQNRLKDLEGTTKAPGRAPKSDSHDEALIVEFDLPPSSYATMFLRELMKQPSTEFSNKF